MATITDIQAQVDALNAELVTNGTKLDAVVALVGTLQAGVPVTQAQIDALKASLDTAKAQADKVLAEEGTVVP